MALIDFIHEKTGRIVRLPAHFADSPVGKGYRPYTPSAEVEEEKVVFDHYHSPNSRTRVARKVIDHEDPTTEPEPETVEED